MTSLTQAAPRIVDKFLNPSQLREFLLTHLNRIFCAKMHLQERLPELAQEANFKDLQLAITETWEDVGKQITRMEEIYLLLEEAPSMDNCEELIGFMEDGFNAIYEKRAEPGLRGLSILFYMSLIESVETVSFKLLQMAANGLPDQQIRQLLQENFDEAKAGRSLFMHLAANYMS